MAAITCQPSVCPSTDRGFSSKWPASPLPHELRSTSTLTGARASDLGPWRVDVQAPPISRLVRLTAPFLQGPIEATDETHKALTRRPRSRKHQHTPCRQRPGNVSPAKAKPFNALGARKLSAGRQQRETGSKTRSVNSDHRNGKLHNGNRV